MSHTIPLLSEERIEDLRRWANDPHGWFDSKEPRKVETILALLDAYEQHAALLASLRQTQAWAGTCDYEDCDQELNWRHAGDGTGFCQYHVATLLHERVAYLEKALVFEQEECIRACQMQIDELTTADARVGVEWCINAIRARGNTNEAATQAGAGDEFKRGLREAEQVAREEWERPQDGWDDAFEAAMGAIRARGKAGG